MSSLNMSDRRGYDLEDIKIAAPLHYARLFINTANRDRPNTKLKIKM